MNLYTPVKIRHSGFSLIEIMISLVLVGVIAALTIPVIVTRSSDQHAIERTKNIAEEILAARTAYLKTSPNTEPNAEAIGERLNYLSKDTSCNSNIMTGARTGELSCGGGCYCYRFQDGGYLQLESGVNGDPTGTPSYLRFSFDPNGATDESTIDPIAMRLYVNSGRITTYGAAANSAALDPDYGKLWSEFD